MVLNNIWYILITCLITCYFILDGYKLGAGIIHLGLKTEELKNSSIKAIGPVKDLNELWLIVALFSLVSVFPLIKDIINDELSYCLYLFIFLFITRNVSYVLRKKNLSEHKRKLFDIMFCISSYSIVLLLGITIGNLITGIPLTNRREFSGTIFTFFRPYQILTGITSVMFIRMYGKIFLAMRTEGELQNKVSSDINSSLAMFLITFIFLAGWTFIVYPHVNQNFFKFPVWFFLPAMIILSIVVIPAFVRNQLYFRAFIASSAILAFCIIIAAVDIYPNLVISNPNPGNGLTIYNSSTTMESSILMLYLVCIAIPAMIVYKIYVNRKIKDRH